jgi:transcriptional regulator with XRE-family HTH domain
MSQATIEEIRHVLAENIKRLRNDRGLAQERLALEAGIDRTMLSKVERKLTNPSLETLLKLANRLEVSIFELLKPN